MSSGLSIGLVCCMLIVLFIHNELSYDSYPGEISGSSTRSGLFSSPAEKKTGSRPSPP